MLFQVRQSRKRHKERVHHPPRLHTEPGIFVIFINELIAHHFDYMLSQASLHWLSYFIANTCLQYFDLDEISLVSPLQKEK